MGALEELREHNRLRVIDELRRRGTASRSDIAEALALSRTTIASVISDLLGSGLVVERPLLPRPTGRGRPPGVLALDSAAGAALGIDFGHEHVRAAVADLSGTILAEVCVELDPTRRGDETAADVAQQTLADAGIPLDRVFAAGVALAGPLDSRRRLARWARADAAQTLERRLNLPVHVDNDANLGALAETQTGAAKGLADVVYVKVSAGIGAGLMIGGKVHRGATGIAGEIGHVQVRADGYLCRCGNRGCLETVASSGALLAVLRPAYGDALTLEGLLALARSGDVAVQRVIADAGRAIGRPLADLCNSLNPELIVIGGELGESEWLLDGVREAIDRHAQPGAARAVSVAAGAHGARASVLGALLLVMEDRDGRILRRLITETT